MSSATEDKIIRSIDFRDNQGGKPHEEVGFLLEQLRDYVQQNFAPQADVAIAEEEESFGNRTYCIRRGSSVIDIKTSFGLNTRYVGNQKESFPSFTVHAAYRNEALDLVENLNSSIELTAKLLTGAFFGLGGLIFCLIFHGGAFFLLASIGAGSAVGAGVGGYIGQFLFERKQASLRSGGELDEMDAEWANLQETLTILFEEKETFRYNTTGTRAWR